MKNIILGIKHAASIPSLPPKLYNFYSHIFTRIFRFIGGITVLITVTDAFEKFQLQNYLNEILCEIIIFTTYLFASIFILLTIIINLIRIVYSIYLIIKKPEIFEVKNSPLNLFATQIAKIITCVKVGCIATGSTAAIVAGGVTFDTLIEKNGRDPIFIPLMAEGLNLILGKPTPLNDVKLPEISNISDSVNTDYSSEAISDALNTYKNLSITEKEAFWKEVSKEFKKN